MLLVFSAEMVGSVSSSSSSSSSMSRGHGVDRFYNPPALRRQLQQQQQEQQQQHQQQQLQQQQSQQQRQKPQRNAKQRRRAQPPPPSAELESRKVEIRLDSDDSSSKPSMSTSPSPPQTPPPPGGNLDRFLQSTTPVVPAQYFQKMIVSRGRNGEMQELQPYFCLGDLWESFGEWSAYGAGVPLCLDGSVDVIQYYVPYLSGIQLYVESSSVRLRIRRCVSGSGILEPLGCLVALTTMLVEVEFLFWLRPGAPTSVLIVSSRHSGENIDAELYRDTSSGRSGNDSTTQYISERMNRTSLGDESNCICDGSSNEFNEVCNPPGTLVFEYLERDPPYGREPLADKVSHLAHRFPDLKTYKSCDLLPSSWISVAWYPIYRIPTGPTLRDLDACFLTFHSFSSFKDASGHSDLNSCGIRNIHNPTAKSVKLALPIFGLASYKFKGSIWMSNGMHEQQQNSLQQAAENWLHQLQLAERDYTSREYGPAEKYVIPTVGVVLA